MRYVFVIAITALTAAAGSAYAASVSNKDAEAVTIVVTEDGERQEVEIAAGGQTQVCPAGCFVSFPAGGMLALTGNENVVVEKGEGKISGE